jgi:hypothetical protein
MLKQITAIFMLISYTFTLNDLNIYADFIVNPELQIFVYNTTIGKINITTLDHSYKDNTTTLQKATSISKTYHSSLNINNITGCDNYTQKQLNITNCTLLVNAEGNRELTKFNLITFGYENMTQILIDFPGVSDFAVFPSLVADNFEFFDCKDSTCTNDVTLHPDYNEYNFKIYIQQTLLNNFEFALLRAFLTVTNDGLISYFVDVTQMLKQKDYFYTLNLDIFPNRFDLHMVYQVRSVGNKTNVII